MKILVPIRSSLNLELNFYVYVYKKLYFVKSVYFEIVL